MSTPEALDRQAGGHRWRIWRWPAPPGSPPAPPVVALHGFTGSGRDVAPVRPKDRAVYAPDLLGHGDSAVAPDPADHSIPRQVAALAALIGGLAAGPVELWGYSFGGRVALSLAVAHPALIHRLVLIGATPGLTDPSEAAQRRAADAARADRLLALGVGPWLAEWQAQPLIATQARIAAGPRAAQAARKASADPRGWAASLRGAGTGSMPPQWDALGGLARPVTLITGADDPKFTALARRMQAALPHATHHALPGAGHCAHLEAPAAFRRALGLLP